MMEKLKQMNDYTVYEALSLIKALDGDSSTGYMSMFTLFLKDDVNDALVSVVQESFNSHEDKMRMIDAIFQVKYEDLPLLVNTDSDPVRHIIKCRLALNK